MNQNNLQSLIAQGIIKQVPIEHSKNHIRFGHPDGYFLRPNGQIAKDTFAPSQYTHRGGSAYPRLRECVNACHILMAYAFYGERPTYVNAKGLVKPYQAHHLNGDKFDYRPANILAWLHPDVHRIADRRQKALRTVVPDGDLHVFSYERLRQLQDPRVLSDAEFQTELEAIRKKHYRRTDPGTAIAEERNKYYDIFVERSEQ